MTSLALLYIIEDEEYNIDYEFHGEFDKNIFHELIVDDILDPVIKPNNPKMDGGCSTCRPT